MAFYCKHCGDKNDELRYLVQGYCSSSPTNKHIAFEGDTTRSEFLCKYCGDTNSELRYLVQGHCSTSPTNKHVAFEGKY